MRCAAPSDGERPFRQSQVDAAVRFCAKVFGQEYASLLAKAAEVASHDQRAQGRRPGLSRAAVESRSF